MSAELEFTVDGHQYRAGRLSAFDQLHVASQWRDVMLGLALAKKGRANAKKPIADAAFREALGFVVTGGLSSLTNQVREEGTRILLSAVTRQQRGDEGVGWASIVTADGTPMFQDIQLAQWIPMFYAVADHNGVLDFFSVSPSTAAGATTENGPRSRAARAG